MSSAVYPTLNPAPVKFDAAFLDRRMAAHRDWQEQESDRLSEDVLDDLGFEHQAHQLELEIVRVRYVARGCARGKRRA